MTDEKQQHLWTVDEVRNLAREALEFTSEATP